MKLFRLLFFVSILLMSGWGNMRAEQLYFEGFEKNHRVSGSNSYGEGPKIYGAWSFSYADAVTSGNPLTGNAQALMRIAKNTTNSPTIVSSSLLTSTQTISKICWKCKGPNTITLTTSYSNNGSDWIIGSTGTLSTTAETKELVLNDIQGPIYIKFVATTTSSIKNNRDIQIDDITIEGTNNSNKKPTLSLIPSETIDWGEIEQGAKDNVNKSVSIKGTNLKGDVTVGLSGDDADKFSISSTTFSKEVVESDGAALEITPLTETIGTHKATITFSTEGADDEKIDLSANVVAPKQTYSIKWNVNGKEYTDGEPTISIKEGENIAALPTPPAGDAIGDCANTFMGWTTSTSVNGDAPTDLFSSADKAPKIMANTTFYAVFAQKESNSTTNEWTLVTDAKDLVAGASYTIASTATAQQGYVLGEQQTSNRKANDWTKAEPAIIVLGGESDAWTFNDGSGYLYAASSNSNHLKVQNKIDANAQWTISFGNQSKATIKAKGTYTRNSLRYNSGSTVFSCYSSGQSDIYLFKWVTPIYTNYTTQCTPTYSVTLSDESVGVIADNNNPTKVLETATSLALKYTAAEYHTLPEKISVSMGGTDLAESAYKWDKETGILTITTSFNGDIVVTIFAVAEKVTPSFTTDLDEAEVTYNEGNEAATLKVVAIGYPEPTYQWYSNSANSTEGAVAIENAKEATYTPSTSKIGTTYYYCVATNDAGKATSKIATITVKELSKYTVIFHVKDAIYPITEVTPNGGVEQPAEMPEKIGDYTFAGWSTTQITEETTEQPNYVALTENKYYPTANIDLYAVYTAKKDKDINGVYLSVEKDDKKLYIGDYNSSSTRFAVVEDMKQATAFWYQDGYLFLLQKGKPHYIYTTGKSDLNGSSTLTKDVTTWERIENEGYVQYENSDRYLAYLNSMFRAYTISSVGAIYNLQETLAEQVYSVQVPHYTSFPSDMVTPTITFDNPTTSVTVDEIVTNVATTTPIAIITYSSSNNEIATVDAEGKVTGHKYGTATITASVAEVPDKYYAASASYDINVQCITTTISFLVDGKEAKSATVYAHNTYKFDVKTNTVAEIKYSLANTSYAETTGEAGGVKIKVSNPFTGNITTTPKSVTTTLFAKADNTDKYTSVNGQLALTITDNRIAQSIELEKKTYAFDINTEVAPFTNTITNADAIKGEIAYQSSNPAIAEVNNKGEVTVHSNVSGMATITITAAAKQVYNESQKAYFDYQEATAQYTITVNYPKPTFSLTGGEYHAEIISEIKADGAEYLYYTTEGTTLIWDAENLKAKGEGVVEVASKDFPAVVTFDKVGNHVVKALAVYGEDFVASPVAEVTYDLVAPSLKYSWAQGEVVDANTDLTITTDDGAKITYILNDANNNTIASGDDLDKEATFRITSMGTYTLSVVSQWDDQDGLNGLSKEEELTVSVKGPATLPFAYNDNATNLPTCFTAQNVGNYDNTNTNTKLKFKDEGGYLILWFEGAPTQLTYNIKFNGTATENCEFKVQTSIDNKTWIDTKTYKGANCIPTEETNGSIDITDHHVHYIKWVYTTKAGGNVGLGNIKLVAIPMEIEAKEEIPSDYHGDVIVKDGATPTITDATQLNSLTIENGGKVTLSNTLEVNDFYINTTMGAGKSGQMIGATNSNFSVQGDAYIDITLGKNGDPNQWHAFTVPFPVDAMNGVYDLDNNKLANEVNYAIMDYHGDIRAKGQYGWKKYRGILNPGTLYLMTVDGERTTYRFKKTGNGALVTNNEMQLREYAANGDGTDTDAGWNGVGNMTLAYGKANIDGITEVQVLNPETYTYEVKRIADIAFTVGTPFFVQAAADGVISIKRQNGSSLYAPALQAAKTVSQYGVHFGNADYMDVLYISASEDATNTYQIGKDLVKMTMSDAPVVSQIFAEAYGNMLCVMYAPLSNDEAVFPLNLYAPKAGEYTISTGEVQGETIYLMQGDNIIWNLTLGEYTLDLEQGNHKGYSILLKAPHVTTDFNPVMDGNGELVEKVFLHNNLYIIRGGKMYDATGKMVPNK